MPPNDQLQSRDDLQDPVGPAARNHPVDVERVERRLGGLGYLDPARTLQPSGRYDGDLEGGLRTYQRSNGLKVDGLLNPNGPTERSLKAGTGRLKRSPTLLAKRPALNAEQLGENRRLVDAIARTTNLGPLPIYIGEAARGRDKGRDELVDLFRQAAERGEDVAARLHGAIRGHVEDTLHRTLFAESQESGNDGDGSATPPSSNPQPTPPKDPGKSDDPNPPGTPNPPKPTPPKGPKYPNGDPCINELLDAEEALNRLQPVIQEISRIDSEIDALKLRNDQLRSGDAEPDMAVHGHSGSVYLCTPDLPLPFPGRRLSGTDIIGSIANTAASCRNYSIPTSRGAATESEIRSNEAKIEQLTEKKDELASKKDTLEKEHKRLSNLLRQCRELHKNE